MKEQGNRSASSADEADAARVQRLQADARRPISVNLAEGIALSHKLIRFSNTLQKS